MDYKWIDFIQFSLFPPRCLVCGTGFRPPPARDLCSPCQEALPRITRACARCGLPMPGNAQPDARCGRCLKQAPPFDRCIAPYVYAPPVSDLVAGLKYGKRLANARLLGELLAGHLESIAAPMPDLILPVPLHSGRVRERGFNQALEIARSLTRYIPLPIEASALRRNRATEAQAGLDRKRRRANVRGAFTVKGNLQGINVAVIDDVVTTGQTAAEIAHVLKRSGCGEISVWAIARTPD